MICCPYSQGVQRWGLWHLHPRCRCQHLHLPKNGYISHFTSWSSSAFVRAKQHLSSYILTVFCLVFWHSTCKMLLFWDLSWPKFTFYLVKCWHLYLGGQADISGVGFVHTTESAQVQIQMWIVDFQNYLNPWFCIIPGFWIGGIGPGFLIPDRAHTKA